MRINILKITLILLMVLSLQCLYAGVSATVSKVNLENGETTNLIIQMDSFNTQPNLAPLDKDFTIYNKSTSSKIVTKNGKTERSYEMTVTMIPNKSGKVIIPAISVGNSKTSPIILNVSSQLNQSEETKYEDVFVLASVSQHDSYVNVPVVYTIKLYYSTQVLGITPKPFDIDGADIKPMQTQNQRTQKRVNGKLYDIIEQSFLITPTDTGELRIPAMVFSVKMPKEFGQLGTTSKYISTKPQSLRIKPIPRDIRIKDWFPAAGVALADEWSSETDTKQGQVLTRNVTITAKGVLSSEIPVLDFGNVKGFNVYAEKPKYNDYQQNGQIVGQAIYTIGYMPTVLGEQTVPALKINWYDIDDHKSKITEIKAKKFDVHPGVLANNSFNNLSLQPSQVVKQVVESAYWKHIAMALFVVWIFTIILFLFYVRKIKGDGDKKHSTSNKKERYATYADIKKACAKKDNIALQIAIILWTEHRFDRKVLSLSEVAEIVPELRTICDSLTAAIYAGKEFNQYGDVLAIIKNSSKVSSIKSKKVTKDYSSGLYC